MRNKKINIVEHYCKLLFFLFNRNKKDNYKTMRNYLADVLISEVEEFIPLYNKKVLDVGGARGEFCRIIHKKRNCDTVNLDPYPELDAYSKEKLWPKTKMGFADNTPFEENQFDLVICRGVLEHIPMEKQQKSVNEMYRVVKTGGICYIMVPPWYSPHGGYCVRPFHILPFKIARFLRQLFFKNKVCANSLAEANLYPITFKKMLGLVSNSGFKILTTKDTHLRLHFLTKIPLIREIAVQSAVFILRKK